MQKIVDHRVGVLKAQELLQEKLALDSHYGLTCETGSMEWHHVALAIDDNPQSGGANQVRQALVPT